MIRWLTSILWAVNCFDGFNESASSLISPISEQIVLLNWFFSMNWLIWFTSRTSHIFWFVHDSVLEFNSLTQWSSTNSSLKKKIFSGEQLKCHPSSQTKLSFEFRRLGIQYIVFFEVFLCHFWSLTDMVTMNCRCMERATFSLFKNVAFVLHENRVFCNNMSK